MQPPAYADEPSSKNFLLSKLAQKWEDEDEIVNQQFRQAISALTQATDEQIKEIRDKLSRATRDLEIHKEHALANQNAIRAHQIDQVTSHDAVKEDSSWVSWLAKKVW